MADSILGHHAHLGAGVMLSNEKLDHGEIAVMTPDGEIATGLRKFGAIVATWEQRFQAIRTSTT